MKIHEFEQPKGDSKVLTDNRVLTMRKFTAACHERGFVLALVAFPTTPNGSYSFLPNEVHALL
jgi:hypothetical protein